MTRIATILVISAGLYMSCSTGVERQSRMQPTPLADTLLTAFSGITEAVSANQPERFFELVDPDEAQKYRKIARQHGYSSLKAYLWGQFNDWPNPDTLNYAGVVANDKYARLTLSGRGTRYGRDDDHVRYTFLLFKRNNEQWKLAAMASLEKEQFDPYGNQISYHETDLPSKLRFPRLL